MTTEELFRAASISAMQDSMRLTAKAATELGFQPNQPFPLENKPFNLKNDQGHQLSGVISYINSRPSVISYNLGNTWVTRRLENHELQPK